MGAAGHGARGPGKLAQREGLPVLRSGGGAHRLWLFNWPTASGRLRTYFRAEAAGNRRRAGGLPGRCPAHRGAGNHPRRQARSAGPAVAPGRGGAPGACLVVSQTCRLCGQLGRGPNTIQINQPIEAMTSAFSAECRQESQPGAVKGEAWYWVLAAWVGTTSD